VGRPERMEPSCCPYCGEEALRPAGPQAGWWQCSACARVFELRFAGLSAHGAGRW
jgi:ribosomal protein L37AE/L43A